MYQKQSILYKISFCALFTSLTIILSRFFSIPGLFALPFLKISFANSIVLFSSFYLGPIRGMIVGGLSDTLGAILFPQGGAYNPIFTIPALLTGLFPYLFYKLFHKIKIDKEFPVSLSVLLILFSTFVTVMLALNDDIVSGKKVYHFSLEMKIVLISLLFGLSVTYIIGAFFIKNKFKNSKLNNNFDIYGLISAMFFTYMIIKNPISSIISSFILNYDFLFILFTKLLTGFFTCLVHSMIVMVLLNISLLFKTNSAINEKYSLRRRNDKEKSC